MRVLPGHENMCVIGRVGLGEKMRLKKLFFQGRHVDLPITRMLSAGAAEIGYGSRMPIQFDGEARWLDSHDFPVRLEVVGRAVRVLAGARMVGSAVDGTSPGV
jgi:diacylglycerol kinase family enzyme